MGEGSSARRARRRKPWLFRPSSHFGAESSTTLFQNYELLRRRYLNLTAEQRAAGNNGTESKCADSQRAPRDLLKFAISVTTMFLRTYTPQLGSFSPRVVAKSSVSSACRHLHDTHTLVGFPFLRRSSWDIAGAWQASTKTPNALAPGALPAGPSTPVSGAVPIRALAAKSFITS